MLLRHKMRWRLYFTLAAAWAGLAAPCQAVTLTELQQLAVANRDHITRSRLDVRESELNAGIRRSANYPLADLRYTANKLDESSLFENKENSELAGVLSYNLFAGFRDKYAIEAADLLVESQRYKLQNEIQELLLQVALRYLDLYARRENLKVAADELSLLDKRYEDATFRFDVGLIRKNDLLRIKVERSNALQNRASAQADYEMGLHLLNFEVGAQVDPESISFAELDQLPEIHEEAYYRQAMFERRAEIKSLEKIVDSQEKQIAVNRADYWPSVNVSAGYRKYGDNYTWGESDDNPEDEVRLQASVNFNLFDGFAKIKRVDRAKVQMHASQRDLNELKNSLKTLLGNILIEVDVSLRNLSVADVGIAQAEENLRVIEAAFDEGLETATEVLDAIFLLSQAKLNYINARSQVFRDYFRLLRLIDGFEVAGNESAAPPPEGPEPPQTPRESPKNQNPEPGPG
jgi:outer membrane protein